MRRRSWIALALVVAGFLFGFLGRRPGATGDALATVGGAFFVAAFAVAVSLLPFWAPLRAKVPAMAGLFRPVPEGGRWCTRCGSPSAAEAPCAVCGHGPRRQAPPSGPAAKGTPPQKKAAKRQPAENAARTRRRGPER